MATERERNLEYHNKQMRMALRSIDALMAEPLSLRPPILSGELEIALDRLAERSERIRAVLKDIQPVVIESYTEGAPHGRRSRNER